MYCPRCSITGFVVLILFFFTTSQSFGQPRIVVPIDSVRLSQFDGKFNFIIANDLGKNGYYDQKPIAEMMGEVSGRTGVDFVAAVGDVHHFYGVQSVNDPLWLTNFELVYSHPELMIPWYPVLGNHEYRGNTSAVLAYSSVSRRWQMPARYYSKSFAVSDSSQVLLVFIDTTPLIDRYRNDSKYADASNENLETQLKWIDETLAKSTAEWKIVLGHHPIFTGTTKADLEQIDLQKRLKPILEKYKVDTYVCGHIHNFQHIKVADSGIDYIVNTSASQARPVVKHEGMVFSSGEAGFMMCSIDDNELKMALINKSGRIVYQFSRKK
ncbi:MAG TPA: metallophosphoesterase [Prolixibacteraceae bacterium]|nr:metallophosphoesterase [Prolixibacteraceae bacterium]